MVMENNVEFEHETVFPMLGGLVKMTIKQRIPRDSREKRLSTTSVFFAYQEKDFSSFDTVEIYSETIWEPNPVVDLVELNRHITVGGRNRFLQVECQRFAEKAVGKKLFALEAEIDELNADR